MSFRRNFSTLAALVVTSAATLAQTAPNQPEPMVLLVPVLVTDPALAAGCWAQFYGKRDFNGDVATLIGPAGFVSLDKGTARELKREIDSLVLGPKATLTVYEHALFKDGSVTFAANSREAGLIKKLGFHGRIESMRLDCTD
ncbi:hypothetical protein [Scleromatobacter humisilvae]|uniref:Calcium-dependent cell adhesion molecule N-terminal domain-containing protein n=1 Tax=Scleromatobacter humisilvae TaxID=2897159 RepID=A0A9X1YP71_9BURK|nr:hypothetical protein [Scleromatobacter humisilvae]MCK9689472.1 hypothetical protein [Scleromatobacter humisilvae]